MEAPCWELVITTLDCMRTGVHKKTQINCQEIYTTIRETCNSVWNVTISCVCNDGKCWRGLQCLQSLIPDIFLLWGIDSGLPLLYFSLSWALLPSSWEMDLPLGPDPISNDISKNVPICFNRSWAGSLPLVLLCIREKHITMTAFFSWDYCVYLDQKLTDVNLTRTNAVKITSKTPKGSISLRRAFSSLHVSQRILMFSCTAQPWAYSTRSTLSHLYC